MANRPGRQSRSVQSAAARRQGSHNVTTAHPNSHSQPPWSPTSPGTNPYGKRPLDGPSDAYNSATPTTAQTGSRYEDFQGLDSQADAQLDPTLELQNTNNPYDLNALRTSPSLEAFASFYTSQDFSTGSGQPQQSYADHLAWPQASTGISYLGIDLSNKNTTQHSNPWTTLQGAREVPVVTDKGSMPPPNKKVRTDSGFGSGTPLPPRTGSAVSASVGDHQEASLNLTTYHHLSRNSAAQSSQVVNTSSTGTRSMDDSSDVAVNTTHRCSECNTTFKSRAELNKHSNRHAPIHRCDHPGCSRGDAFATKNDLDRHKKCVHGIRDANTVMWKCLFPGCSKAGKDWPRQDNFKAHIIRMHGSENVDEYLGKGQVRKEGPAGGPTPDMASSASAPAPDFPSTVRPEQLSVRRPPQPSGRSANLWRPNSGGHDAANVGDPSGFVPPRTSPATTRARTRSLQPPPRASRSRAPVIRQRPAGWRPQPHAGAATASQGTSAGLGDARSHTMRTSGSEAGHDTLFPMGRPQERSSMLEYPGWGVDSVTAPWDPLNEFAFQTSCRPRTVAGDIYERNLDGLDHVREHDHMFGSRAVHDHAALDGMGAVFPIGGIDVEMSHLPPDEPEQAPHPTWAVDMPPPSPVDQSQEAAATRVSVAMMQFAEQHGLSDDQLRRILVIIQNGPGSSPNAASASDAAGRSAGETRVVPTRSVNNTTTRDEETESDRTKPFRCSKTILEGNLKIQCPKRWERRNELRKHEKRHERLFGCTYDHCYKRFGSKWEWRRHEQRSHEQHECWRCPASTNEVKPCAMVFYDRGEFREHLSVIHRLSQPEVTEKLKTCRVARRFQGEYWCGFCRELIHNDASPGVERDKQRYKHIYNHIVDGWRTSNWVELEGQGKTKGEMQQGAPRPKQNVDDELFDVVDDREGFSADEDDDDDDENENENDDDDHEANTVVTTTCGNRAGATSASAAARSGASSSGEKRPRGMSNTSVATGGGRVHKRPRQEGSPVTPRREEPSTSGRGVYGDLLDSIDPPARSTRPRSTSFSHPHRPSRSQLSPQSDQSNGRRQQRLSFSNNRESRLSDPDPVSTTPSSLTSFHCCGCQSGPHHPQQQSTDLYCPQCLHRPFPCPTCRQHDSHMALRDGFFFLTHVD